MSFSLAIEHYWLQVFYKKKTKYEIFSQFFDSSKSAIHKKKINKN